jgi:Fe-Mn family superoxide dismutase
MNDSLSHRVQSAAVSRPPAGLLADAINRDFGSLAQLQARFAAMADELEGTGWVWLASGQDDGGRLHVLSTTPHRDPMLQGYCPLLQHYVPPPARRWVDRHERAAALSDWWRAVNWEQVARRHRHAGQLRSD